MNQEKLQHLVTLNMDAGEMVGAVKFNTCISNVFKISKVAYL